MLFDQKTPVFAVPVRGGQQTTNRQILRLKNWIGLVDDSVENPCSPIYILLILACGHHSKKVKGKTMVIDHSVEISAYIYIYIIFFFNLIMDGVKKSIYNKGDRWLNCLTFAIYTPILQYLINVQEYVWELAQYLSVPYNSSPVTSIYYYCFSHFNRN